MEINMLKLTFVTLLALTASVFVPIAQAADTNIYGSGAACIRLCKTDKGTGCDIKKHPDHPGVCAEQQKECISHCKPSKARPGYGLRATIDAAG